MEIGKELTWHSAGRRSRLGVRLGHEVLVQAGAGLSSGCLDADIAAGTRSGRVETSGMRSSCSGSKNPSKRNMAISRTESSHLFASRGHAPGPRPALLTKRTAPSPTRPWKISAAGCRSWRRSAPSRGTWRYRGQLYLARFNGGRGTQLGGVLGTRHGKVVVIGDGVVGRHAARTAAGMGAHTYIGGHEERLPEIRRELSDSVDFSLERRNVAMHLSDAISWSGRCWSRGRKGPACGHGGNGQGHAARLGDRGCEHRSRRLHRDLSANVTLRARVRKTRRHPLLRDQYAGGLSQDLDARAQLGDVTLCLAAGGWGAVGVAGRYGLCEGAQHLSGLHHLQAGRRSPGPRGSLPRISS